MKQETNGSNPKDVIIEAEFNWGEYQKDILFNSIKRYGSLEKAVVDMDAKIADLDVTVEGLREMFSLGYGRSSKTKMLVRALKELKELELTMSADDPCMDLRKAFDYLIRKVQYVIKRYEECSEDSCSLCGTLDEVHQCSNCYICFCITCDKGEMIANEYDNTIRYF